ncbi:MAG: pilus assembly protein TadG-related protein [Actinomycetota bacterium]
MDERGQITVMVLGFVVVVMSVLGVAIDGTKAFIHRRTLQNAADAAVLAAAGELDTQAYYSSGGSVVQLDQRAARRRAAEWLSMRGVGAVTDIHVDAAGVSLVLRDTVSSGFLGLLGISRLPVVVEAVAEPHPGAP